MKAFHITEPAGAERIEVRAGDTVVRFPYKDAAERLVQAAAARKYVQNAVASGIKFNVKDMVK